VTDIEWVRAVYAATSKPFNFMAGIRGRSFTVDELAAAGACRISRAGSLYRAAIIGLLAAAHEVKDRGTFDYLDHAVTTPEVYEFMQA
jgi:2-methylisocitrate lyase-like PEP mutase family enzyme